VRRLWKAAVPIETPKAAPGADYLWSRGIPLVAAVEARVRYHLAWPGEVDGVSYRLPAIVFPVRGAAGVGVAAEGRWLNPPTPASKARTGGPKSLGVFLASPGALDADDVAICEGAITSLSLAACGLPAIALCGHHNAPQWLVERLAFRNVYVAIDEDEKHADTTVTKLAGRLAVVGAKPYRLRPQGFAGDWNAYLVAHGAPALRGALDAALTKAFVG
jgi:hypothetical protein